MKTQRFSKIAAIALAMLLLVGAVVGITVAAEDTGATSLTVAGKNLAYEGALQVVYYVDAPNYNAENQTLKMNFWVGAIGNAPSYTKEFNENDVMTVGGKTYYCFFSNGIAPVDMTKPIYAQAFIENADGTTVTEGEIAEYSVYTYAMNRFSQSPTEDQLTLYKALLDYGAAVQDVLGDPADIEKFGWADAYYDITKYVFVDDALVADESLTRSTPYRPSELELDAEGKLPLALANSTLNGAYFKNITDEDGAIVEDQYALPGIYTYNVNYTTAGTFTDYNDKTDVNTLFIPNTSNAVQYQAWWSGYITNPLNTKAETGTYMLLENGYLATGTDGVKGNYGGWQIDINNGTNLPVAAGVTYVVAFDYKIAIKEAFEGNDGQLAWFGLNYSEDGYWSEGGKATEGRGANIVNLDNYVVGDNTYVNNSSATVPSGEWFNIRVEYEIVSLDNSATAENEAKANVRIYIDGVLAVSTMSDRAKAPESLLLYMRASVAKVEYQLDNLYVNSYAPSAKKGAGAYINGAASADANKVTVDDVTDLNTVLSANGFDVNNKKANNALFVDEKGNIVAKTAGNAASFVVAGPDNTNNDGERGVKYIAELDLKVNATDAQAGAVVGTLAIYADAEAQNAIASIDVIKNADGTVSVGNKKLNPNTWYNIRLEYKIEANGFKIDNAVSFDGTFNVYVFTDLAYTASIEGDVDNRTFGSFGYAQGAAISTVTLDNFCTDYIPLAGTKGNGTYYKQHVENAAKDVATAEQFIDFTGKSSVTAAFKNVTTSNIHTTWKNSDKRWIMTTGADAMMFGGNVWSETVATLPEAVTAAEGEKIIVEFDYLFEGADGGSGQYIEFRLMNGSTALIQYKFYNRNSGTGFWFSPADWSENYVSGELNKWYNIRIEITYSASGSQAQVYIDNVKTGAVKTISADASTLTGIKLTGRPAAGPNANSLFDNIVVDNTSTSKTSSYYGMYNKGELTDAKLVDMTGKTSIYDVVNKQAFQQSNSRPTAGNNSYGLIEDGVFTFGTLYYWSEMQIWNEKTDLPVGTKYVIEYDYRFNGHGSLREGAKTHALSAMHVLNGAGGSLGYIEAYINDDPNKTNLCFNNDGATFTTINAGEWHKISFEIEVTETGYTMVQRLDGVAKKTFTSTSSAASILGFRALVNECASSEHSYDNFVFAVIPPVAE